MRQAEYTVNRTLYEMKWCPARSSREKTKRGVLYTGYACDLKCIFCYYRDNRPTLTRLNEMKEKVRCMSEQWGLKALDISGGEPLLHPDLPELVETCRQSHVLPSIITNCQRLNLTLAERLKNAGVVDFLVSWHGVREDHNAMTGGESDSYKKLRMAIDNLQKLDIPFRINTVVTDRNVSRLPQLAKEIASTGAYVSNFINFNPFCSWTNKEVVSFQSEFRRIVPRLREAVQILTSCSVEVNLRYFPFCQLKGLEKHIMNFPQLPYDHWEWDYRSHGERCFSDLDLFRIARKMQSNWYSKSYKCFTCSLFFLCDGFTKNYVNKFGFGEEVPYRGLPTTDFIKFSAELPGERLNTRRVVIGLLTPQIEQGRVVKAIKGFL